MLTLTDDNPRRSTTREELRELVTVKVARTGSPSSVTRQEKSPEDWTTLLTLRAKAYYSVGELGVSDGGMFKYSEDHSESQGGALLAAEQRNIPEA